MQSLSTSGWFILAMAMYPGVQARAHKELDDVLGHGSLPEHQDFVSLPYIHAILLEVLRWRPTIPLGIPHRVMVDDEYNGYRIPAGTIIVPVSSFQMLCGSRLICFAQNAWYV